MSRRTPQQLQQHTASWSVPCPPPAPRWPLRPRPWGSRLSQDVSPARGWQLLHALSAPWVTQASVEMKDSKVLSTATSHPLRPCFLLEARDCVRRFPSLSQHHLPLRQDRGLTASPAPHTFTLCGQHLLMTAAAPTQAPPITDTLRAPSSQPSPAPTVPRDPSVSTLHLAAPPSRPSPEHSTVGLHHFPLPDLIALRDPHLFA